MKFETRSGDFLEIEINYLDCQMNGSGYMFAELKKNSEPFVPYLTLLQLECEAEDHAFEEKKYADKLRMDAPYSSTYSMYSFYHRGGSDPDLNLLTNIQAQLKKFDIEQKNAKIIHEGFTHAKIYSAPSSPWNTI